MVWDFYKRFVIFAKKGSVIRRIAWLTIIGLAVSVSSLVLVLSIMTALNRNQKERTLAVEPHLIIEVNAAKEIQSVENHPIAQKLKTLLDTKSYYFETQDVILRTVDGKFRGAIARGLSWLGLKSMLLEISKTLKKSSDAQVLEKPEVGDVIIGVDLAHALGVFEGDTLMVVPPEGLLLPPSEAPKYERVRVLQILVTNVTDIDNQFMYFVTGETLRTLKESASRRVGIEVHLTDPDGADQLKQDLSGFSDTKIETWKERNSALFFALKLEKIMIGIFLGMATLIAGLSLISVTSLLISQKQREIGLLQALGFSKNKIQKLFSSIGFLLAVSGIGTGLLIGTGLSYYLEIKPLNILPDIYYDSLIQAEVQLPFVFIVAAVGFTLAYLGARMAAKAAAKLNPSQALRNYTAT